MKKSIPILAAAAACGMFQSGATAAAQEYLPAVIKVKAPLYADFTEAQAVPMEDAQTSRAHAIRGNFLSTNSLDSITHPELVKSPNWKYYFLKPGTYIETRDMYYVAYTENVRIDFVQYPTYYDVTGQGTAYATYQFVTQGLGSNSVPIAHWGNFKSESTSLTFYNVPAGYYKLRITNWSEYDQDGNGFTWY